MVKAKVKITNRQSKMIANLGKVTYYPGSFDKRFSRSLTFISEGDNPFLTEKQIVYLEKMYHKYRRQIKNHAELCKFCSAQMKMDLFK